MEFDTEVKLSVYCTIAETTRAPASTEVAGALGSTVEEVEAAFQRLCQKRLLVMEPGSASKILMAPPFSAVETPFLVNVGNKSYYANCAWDAFGVATALHQDARVSASDGYTGEPITLQISSAKPVIEECVAHFAVPAARWWDDIIYT